MATIGLKIYELTISLRNPKKDDEDGPLQMSIGGQHNIYSIVYEILHGLEKNSEVIDISKFFKSEKQKNIHKSAIEFSRVIENPQKGIIKGVANFGEYGRTGSIRDVTENKETHSKTIEEADLEPYYFRFHFMNNVSSAILMTQSISNKTVKMAIEKLIKYELRDSRYVLKIKPLADQETITKYFEYGELVGIKGVLRKRVKEDREVLTQSKIGGRVLAAGMAIEFYMGKFGRTLNKCISTAHDIWKGESKMSKLVELPGVDEIDELYAQVELDGKTRTIPIHKRDDMALVYDCNDLKKGQDGHVIPEIWDTHLDNIWINDIRPIIE